MTRRTLFTALAAAPIVKAGSSYPLDGDHPIVPGHCPLHNVPGRMVVQILAEALVVQSESYVPFPMMQCPECGLLFSPVWPSPLTPERVSKIQEDATSMRDIQDPAMARTDLGLGGTPSLDPTKADSLPSGTNNRLPREQQ